MSLKQNKTQLSVRKKRPLWLKILLIGLAVVFVLIALGPSIVSTSPLRNWAVGKINRQINGRVSIDSWSIGWFTGVEIQGLSLEIRQVRFWVNTREFSITRLANGVGLASHSPSPAM